MLDSDTAANVLRTSIGTFMGRDALRLAALSLGLDAASRVLMSAYVCKEVLRVFQAGSEVEFYDVDPDLTVAPENLESRFRVASPDAVVLINYFGFLQPHREAIKELCRANGVMLIEDCAHSILTEGSGDCGDLCVYSFRKLLPVPDGGALRLNHRRNGFQPRFYPRLISNLLSVLIMLKLRLKIRSAVLSRAGIAGGARKAGRQVARGYSDRPCLPISSFAQYGVRRGNVQDIIAKRRNDYLVWQDWSRQTGCCRPIFNGLPVGVCPMGFPVTVRNRDKIKADLEAEGVYLKVHWNLPVAVAGDCINSHALSKETITLPVHPDLKRGERESIIKVFERHRAFALRN
jgi:hypothetical protein